MSSKAILALAARLTVGTSVVRALSAATQFVLVFWLVPEEFGYWAAANASIGILAGFSNLGMVNAYLAKGGISRARLLRDTTLANVCLAVIGCGIAAAYFSIDRPQVGVLALVAGTTIPLAGAADAYHALRIEQRDAKRILASQTLAALSRIGIGVSVAALTQSAIALAMANMGFWLVSLILMYSKAPSRPSDDPPITPMRDRASWLANRWALTFQVQAVIVAAQFFASANELGLFFIGYQLIIAVQSLLAAPLQRVVISGLAGVAAMKRHTTAARLVPTVGAVALVGAGLLTVGLVVLGPVLPPDWTVAVPVATVLAALLPTRLLVPIVDGDMIANARWRLSTSIYLLDGAGCVVLAIVLVPTGPVALAGGVFLWKSAIALARIAMLIGKKFRGGMEVMLLAALSILLAVGGLMNVVTQVSIAGAVAVVGVAWLLVSLRQVRAEGAL